MRIVITGGAGFVGSNLAAAYLRRGHSVTVLDNLYRGGAERNLEWLRHQPGSEQLDFIRGDVRDPGLVQRVIGASDVHLVFHLAAQTAVTTSIARPREDLEVNLNGTINVLEALRVTRASTPPILFFTSTNKVYGAIARRDVVETDTRYRFVDEELDRWGVDELEPLDFHSPYGCSKGAADQYVRDYSRVYGLPTVVFRMSCIYGPRQFGNEDQGWLAHFLIAAAGHRPLTIYGNGKQVRDLLYVDDLLRAFELAAEEIHTTAGNVYNIGGGPTNSISVWRELKPRLEALSGNTLQPRIGEWRAGDQPIYASNTSAAQRDFRWTPLVSVAEGLERLWAWTQAQPHLFESSGETTVAAGATIGTPHPGSGSGVKAGSGL